MKLKFKSFTENRFVRAVGELAQQNLIILLVTYLLLLLAETIWEKSASSVLNLNYLLIAVIVLGIPAVLAFRRKPDVKVRESIGGKDILMVACAGVVGAVIVWYKTKDIGWPSVIMSIISAVLIVILSLLILREGDEGEDTKDK